MDNKEYLTLLPKRECDYEVKDGLATITFIKPENKFEKLLNKILKPKPSKIDLDEIGSFVWELIDGVRTVENIIELSRERFAEKIEPAEERVVLFIKQLSQWRLITLYKKETA